MFLSLNSKSKSCLRDMVPTCHIRGPRHTTSTQTRTPQRSQEGRFQKTTRYVPSESWTIGRTGAGGCHGLSLGFSAAPDLLLRGLTELPGSFPKVAAVSPTALGPAGAVLQPRSLQLGLTLPTFITPPPTPSPAPSPPPAFTSPNSILNSWWKYTFSPIWNTSGRKWGGREYIKNIYSWNETLATVKSEEEYFGSEWVQHNYVICHHITYHS